VDLSPFNQILLKEFSQENKGEGGFTSALYTYLWSVLSPENSFLKSPSLGYFPFPVLQLQDCWLQLPGFAAAKGPPGSVWWEGERKGPSACFPLGDEALPPSPPTLRPRGRASSSWRLSEGRVCGGEQEWKEASPSAALLSCLELSSTQGLLPICLLKTLERRHFRSVCSEGCAFNPL
jgi:hypothetical protein